MRSVDHNCIVIGAIPVAALGATSLGFQAVTQNIIHALKLWVLDVARSRSFAGRLSELRNFGVFVAVCWLVFQ